MWSTILCLALLAPAVFAKSVTLDELKRALTDYLDEERDGEIGDPASLFGGAREEDEEERQDGPLLGGGVGTKQGDLDPSELFSGAGARSGPMAQLDMRSLFERKEKRDSEHMSNRLLEAVKEVEAAVEAGTQLRKQSRSTRTDRAYTMCVYCDNMCLQQIASAGYSSDDYFAIITDDMNAALASLDENGLFSLSFKLIPGSAVYMDWFGDSSLTGEELLAAINTAFWADTGLYDMATNYGCDVDFLLASGNDPAWNAMGSIEGIANMMQLCQMSYSTVKISNNPANTATLMAHEFGHMIGAYHDGSVNSAYTSLEAYFAPGQLLGGCSDNYATLQAECTSATPNNCVMSAVVGGATEFSSCSRAYFDMFVCLSDVMPTWYSLACV